MPAAYIVASLEVTDPEAMAVYSKAVPAVVAAYGGEFLARGGTAELKEGDIPCSRVVIVRFPSYEAAQRWYHSPEYAEILPIRLGAARGPFIITEGLPDGVSY